MFKVNIFILLLAFCFQSFVLIGQHNNFTITGNITGAGEDSVIIIINNYDAEGKMLKPDTLITKAKGGHFYFKGITTSTKAVWASIGGFKSRSSFSFYLEPGNIKIAGDKTASSDISITGTISNNEKTETDNHTNSIYQRSLLLRESLKQTTKGTTAYNSIVKDMDTKYDSIQSYKLNYLKTHPNSFVSVTFLWVKQDNLPVDELENLFKGFAPALQNTAFGLAIRDKIKARKFVAVGNPAPDFVSTDTSGNPVRLSDFRGKYVLLEFWANWCVPCREEHPNLVAMYNKFNSKGFTIMQYSMDDKTAESKWKDAIIKDGLIWTEVSDLNGFESKVAKLYGVQPIPDNFLIGPDGKILARGLRGEALSKKLEEIFN